MASIFYLVNLLNKKIDNNVNTADIDIVIIPNVLSTYFNNTMAFVSLFFPSRNAVYSLTFGLRFLCLLTTIHNSWLEGNSSLLEEI